MPISADSAVLRDVRPGHFGLPGMRERAKELHARLGIWSKPGAGTEVEIRVPAAIAYRECARRSRRKRWWRKASTANTEDAAPSCDLRAESESDLELDYIGLRVCQVSDRSICNSFVLPRLPLRAMGTPRSTNG